MRKPEWLKVRVSNSKGYQETLQIAKNLKLNTVCQEAACPNISECWSKKHATFIIMGDTCTRSCRFCNIKTGKPNVLDPQEPIRLADAITKLELQHVVITSVDRDDLIDGGASHFAACIKEIRKNSPNITIEILTPDFLRKPTAIEIIVRSKPEVFNHNLETVPSLYPSIRPGARYFHSLDLLNKVKSSEPEIFTKSGIMLGLGETKEEVLQVMDDMRIANVDFLTIGQYLQPTPKHAEVKRFIEPETFEYFARVAKTKGFLMVSSSPFTRSSYHADEDFKTLRENRLEKLRA